MCTFSMEPILQNINEIWSSDLQVFTLKGFGLARVYYLNSKLPDNS